MESLELSPSIRIRIWIISVKLRAMHLGLVFESLSHVLICKMLGFCLPGAVLHTPNFGPKPFGAAGCFPRALWWPWQWVSSLCIARYTERFNYLREHPQNNYRKKRTWNSFSSFFFSCYQVFKPKNKLEFSN